MQIIKVINMNCSHCETAIKNALTDLGAEYVKTNLTDSTVEFKYDKPEDIETELKELGYL